MCSTIEIIDIFFLARSFTICMFASSQPEWSIIVDAREPGLKEWHFQANPKSPVTICHTTVKLACCINKPAKVI